MIRILQEYLFFFRDFPDHIPNDFGFYVHVEYKSLPRGWLRFFVLHAFTVYFVGIQDFICWMQFKFVESSTTLSNGSAAFVIKPLSVIFGEFGFWFWYCIVQLLLGVFWWSEWYDLLFVQSSGISLSKHRLLKSTQFAFFKIPSCSFFIQ